MNTAVTLPARVHVKRRHLVGLLVAVAVLTAVVTWTLVTVTYDIRPARTGATARTTEQVLASLSPDARRYVEGVVALTPLQRAAIYGTDPLDALELDPQARQYVEGIQRLTPEQLAAGFGNVPVHG